SEYKAPRDGVVKEVCVAEGDTIDGNQALVILE
ncbi:biotin/lipoyl-containing protein, partial [Candidatus Venteria ishoeyi]